MVTQMEPITIEKYRSDKVMGFLTGSLNILYQKSLRHLLYKGTQFNTHTD
jgi:hypothetical protein